MKKALTAGLVIAFAATTFATESAVNQNQLGSYPKNLARHHVGANLLIFDEGSKTFIPTEAAAAWLDDDVATGWPAMPAKHYYLLSLADAELMTNFEISTRGTTGTVSLFTGDEPAPPSAKSWTPVAVNLPVESVNHKRLERPFSRLAKYLLVETDFSQSGPIYSLYLYGEKSAAAYSLEKRDGSADVHAAYGKFVNDQTSISENALYTNGRVASSNGTDSPVNLQRAIDDNPETAVTISPSTADNGMVIRFAQDRSIDRVSLLSSAPVKGKVEIYAVSGSAKDAAAPKATATIALDGVNPRGSVEFPSTTASEIGIRWIPETAGEKLGVSEVNSFGSITLASYNVSTAGTIASNEKAGRRDVSKGEGDAKDGKDAVAPEGKNTLPPVGELEKSPYVPGGLQPPPIITEHPVSP